MIREYPVTRNKLVDGVSLSKQDQWFGTYRHIVFEINRFANSIDPILCDFTSLGLNPCGWSFYISLHENNIPEDQKAALFLPEHECSYYENGPKRARFDYYESSISRLEWHGDITYGKYECTFPGHRVLKVGCDYNHYFDAGKDYQLEDIVVDVKICIDSLHEQVHGLLVRNQRDGKYITEAELQNKQKDTQ